MNPQWPPDDEIDRVVREMTAREPAEDFTRRVMARVREDAPATWITLPRLAAAGAFAVFVVAIALWWPAWRQTPIDVAVSGPAVETPARTPPEMRPRGPIGPSTTPGAGAAVFQRTAVGRARAGGGELPPPVQTVVIAPLDPIAPIAPATLVTDAIEGPEVVVLPLDVLPPVDVEPIPAPEGRT